jgi:hypothetical protein
MVQLGGALDAAPWELLQRGQFVRVVPPEVEAPAPLEG